MLQTKYVSGDWNSICDRCGVQFKASELREDWKGLRLCDDDWEPRHPQDFVRARSETITPPWIRTDEKVTNTVITVSSGTPLTASLIDTLFYYDSTAGNIIQALPDATNAAFHGAEIVYVIHNRGTANQVTITVTGGSVGSLVVAAGQTGRFQTSPPNNIWRRL